MRCWPSARPSRRPNAPADPPGHLRRANPAAEAQPRGPARPGDRDPQGHRPRPRPPVPDGGRAGRGPAARPRGPTGPRPTSRRKREVPPLVSSQPGAGGPAGGSGARLLGGLRPGRLEVARGGDRARGQGRAAGQGPRRRPVRPRRRRPRPRGGEEGARRLRAGRAASTPASSSAPASSTRPPTSPRPRPSSIVASRPGAAGSGTSSSAWITPSCSPSAATTAGSTRWPTAPTAAGSPPPAAAIRSIITRESSPARHDHRLGRRDRPGRAHPSGARAPGPAARLPRGRPPPGLLEPRRHRSGPRDRDGPDGPETRGRQAHPRRPGELGTLSDPAAGAVARRPPAGDRWRRPLDRGLGHRHGDARALVPADPHGYMGALFSPDVRCLATLSGYDWGGGAGYPRVWNVATGAEAVRLDQHDQAACFSLAISPDSRTLAGGSARGPILLWNLADGRLRKTLTGHEGPVLGLASVPMACNWPWSVEHRTVRSWEIESGLSTA